MFSSLGALGLALGVLGLGALGGCAWHRVVVRDLRRRVAETCSSGWRVLVNGVEVGVIRDMDYAGLKLAVATDPRVYVAQVFGFVRVASRLLIRWLLIVPIGCFWALLAAALLDPAGLLAGMEALARGPSALSDGVMAALKATTLVFGLHVLFPTVISRARFGYVNAFAEALHRQIRLRLNVVAEGDVSLVHVAALEQSGAVRPLGGV